jgi:hypothetical protein
MLEKRILSTNSTPEINLNPYGVIEIRGRSMGRNLCEFSKQIEDWIKEYILEPPELTCIDFYLEYLKGLDINIYISLLKKITSISLKNKKYIINWHYEEGDEDILEKGECISLVLDIPFNFIKTCDTLIPECEPLK